MLPRFHAAHLTTDASDLVLPPGESAHLARVLRLAAGSAVEVFDGRGLLRAGVVVRPAPQGSVLLLGERRAAAAEPPASLTIVQALLKGDAMDAVVRDATVLGATTIQPVTSARANVPARAVAAAHERWNRVAVAAAKQCGRATLPMIAPVAQAAALWADHGGIAALAPHASRLWLTEPNLGVDAHAEVPDPPHPVCLAIGPEGGWTAEEWEAARTGGWHAWTLGPITLRAEQVTLAALSVIRYAWAAAGRRMT